VLLVQAQREQQRQEELVARRLVSAQAAEQARSAMDSLRARLSSQPCKDIDAQAESSCASAFESCAQAFCLYRSKKALPPSK
jgi:multidrug resistance efflux pump